MIREPGEVTINEHGQVEIPMGVLAEAGLGPRSAVVVYRDGDGRTVMQRREDMLRDLIERGSAVKTGESAPGPFVGTLAHIAKALVF